MKNFLPQSLLPQSLFARLVGALLGVIVVTLLLIVILILRERRELALWGSGAWSSATTIADMSAKLAALDPEARSAELEKYRLQARPVQEILRHRPPPARKDIAAIEKAFAERVRGELGPGYTVSIAGSERRARNVIRLMGGEMFEFHTAGPPEAGVRGEIEGPPGFGPGAPELGPEIGFAAMVPAGPPRGAGPLRLDGPMSARVFDVTVGLPDGRQLTFRAPAPLPGPPLPRQIFLDLGLLTGILAIVLFFMTRNITRPLSELVRAADAMGRGENLPPLKERGARELRAATRAFNAMQDRLHRYLDSRTRVLAAMSHDLRTPLTRLRLRAEAIDDTPTRERFVSDVDEMTQMVNGALNLFKGLTDTESYAPVMVDELLAAMQSEYAELGESVSVEGRSNGPITAKPTALKRCLSNLLHNAVKYGGRAIVRITDGTALVISISDEGDGIPAEALELVFEPFYRLESSRSRDTGGTGLGLSIARDIAQAHGGSIVLKNLPGRGLEALLTLPRSTDHAA
jgi:signal transduction histidine kinase